MSRISDRNNLEKWLAKKPPIWGRIIAARTAVRVVPCLAVEFDARDAFSQTERDVIMAGFRGMTGAWVAACWPERSAQLAASLSAASAAMASVSNPSVQSICFAVAAVEPTFRRHGKDNAISAVHHAAIASPSADDIWTAVSIDANNLQGSFAGWPNYLMTRPLWSGETPTWAASNWAILKRALLGVDEDWEVWCNWYEARINGVTQRRLNERLEAERVQIAEEIWEQGPKVVNAHIKRLIEEHAAKSEIPLASSSNRLPKPLDNIPSPFGFQWSTGGTIELVAGIANWPSFPLHTSEQDHRDRLDVCRAIAQDLVAALSKRKYQARVEYADHLSRYVERLPHKPGDGNILLADAEARTLRSLFAADAAILSPAFAAQLKTFLEQHIGLRPFYPQIEQFYRDVQAGRIVIPLPQDAVDGLIEGVKANTPTVFDASVSDAIEGSAQPEQPAVQPIAKDLAPADVGQPVPPKDPLGEVDPHKARDYTVAGTVNGLWKVLLEGEKVHKTVDGWNKTVEVLKPHVTDILDWLRQFTGQ